jgi:hypothetical protein
MEYDRSVGGTTPLGVGEENTGLDVVEAAGSGYVWFGALLVSVPENLQEDDDGFLFPATLGNSDCNHACCNFVANGVDSPTPMELLSFFREVIATGENLIKAFFLPSLCCCLLPSKKLL